jgi:hypothetical protein
VSLKGEIQEVRWAHVYVNSKQLERWEVGPPPRYVQILNTTLEEPKPCMTRPKGYDPIR